MTQTNSFGPSWIDAFLRRRDPEETARESAFVARVCPLPKFARILDVPCGLGRHANALAAKGYRVTGVDRNAALVAEAAASAAPGAAYLTGDVRHLDLVPGEFDAVICLWQSFGWFDEVGNAMVLAGMAAKLRPKGRIVIDVCHHDHFAKRQGVREFDVAGVRVVEERRLDGRRETVTLRYSDGSPHDVFEWRLYTPSELIALGAGVGLERRIACSRFDEGSPATNAEPRMQLVFERMM